MYPLTPMKVYATERLYEDPRCVARMNRVLQAIDYPLDDVTRIADEGLPEVGNIIAGIHPNPFNPSTRIDLSIVSEGQVTVRIYSVTGRLVRTLVDEYRGAGDFHVYWDGTDEKGNRAASAAYFCQLQSNGQMDTRKVLLLK